MQVLLSLGIWTCPENLSQSKPRTVNFQLNLCIFPWARCKWSLLTGSHFDKFSETFSLIVPRAGSSKITRQKYHLAGKISSRQCQYTHMVEYNCSEHISASVSNKLANYCIYNHLIQRNRALGRTFFSSSGKKKKKSCFNQNLLAKSLFWSNCINLYHWPSI